ncbi:MAG: DUF397 domain-containing protein [Sciscionella sp.]
MTSGPQRWRKSSYSSTSTNCVELASGLDRVRDSKGPDGAILHADLRALLTALRSGRFDR